MNPTLSGSYVERPQLDAAIARCLRSGAGVYTLEGPGGSGKSAALLHGLASERERRGKSGRGHLRVLQLWGDEPPSLFAGRLVREVGLLNLVAYPEPEKLARLAADMAQHIPGLSSAGKLLGALVADDMRPLPVVAAQALAEAGQRAIAAGELGGPLAIGVDLLGGEVSAPVRDFFHRLRELLPETVVLILAQPGGHNSLLTVPPAQRLAAGPFTPAEAEQFLAGRLGPLDREAQELLESGRLSLLPGDLALVVNLYTFLGQGRRLSELLPELSRDIASRYQAQFESKLVLGSIDPRVLELCGLCAATVRPQQPLTLELALRRLGAEDGLALRPSELAQLRQEPLVRLLCATATTTPTADRRSDQHPLAERSVGWPLEPANAQARDGVRQALERHGLLEVYEQRWLSELLGSLRRSPHPDRDGLLAGIGALSLLTERAHRHSPGEAAADGNQQRQKQALGQAVALLGELETPLWRAGWHRAFAELYDALLPHLERAGVAPRDAAPRLLFRRARARIQNLDWTPATFGDDPAAALDPPAVEGELGLALAELDQLALLGESAIVEARVQIGLSTAGKEVGEWCRHLPFKARQARGYARVLEQRLLGSGPADRAQSGLLAEPLDDILVALGHFVASGELENSAQTLTILGDLYSVQSAAFPAPPSARQARTDQLAIYQYEQAVALAQRIEPLPTFALGVIHRSIAQHHQRCGREAAAHQQYATARRYLLRSPDARMGALLAGLLPT